MINNKNSGNGISIIGIIEVVAWFTLALTIAALFDGYQIIFFELPSPFRVQYLLASFLCFLAFMVFKRYKWAVVMVLVSGLNLAYVLPWYFSPAVKIPDDASSAIKTPDNPLPIKLILSNVNSANRNFQALLGLVKTESPDILVVQEVTSKWLAELRQLEASYPHKFTIAREDNFGIAMYSKFPFDSVEEHFWGGLGIPSLQAAFTVAGKRFTTIATHPFPPINAFAYASRNTQLEDVSQASKGIKDPLILIGDLNITMWSGDYKVLEDHTNLSNARKGFGILPTWPANMPTIFQIPIDHCLVSPDFVVEDIKVGNDIGSDHLPLILKLGL